MTDTLLNLAEDNISRRNVNIHKFNHPWLTERSEETVRRKHTAQGLAVEAEAARECSAFFLEEQYAYVQTMRVETMVGKTSENRRSQAKSFKHSRFNRRSEMYIGI